MKQHFARAIDIDATCDLCLHAELVSTSRCEMDISNDNGKAPGGGPMVAACGNGSDAELVAEDTLTATTAAQPQDASTSRASLLNVKCEVKSCSILVLRHPNKS